ncbi:MAG TPA: YihY/virulence factor BrkB family protein [Acidimicrobiales bacterium]|nr:YihY/virulence factor BrkB family protein [Acidimicrobiales bacterium]
MKHLALDRLQRRRPALGLPIAVIYKFSDDQGAYLASLMTYYGFLSVFPLLLLAVTVLGFVLRGNPQLQSTIIHSALSQFPDIGQQLSSVHGYRGSGLGLVVGLVGAVYGGMGVAQAAQNAMNVVWAVPRNERPNPIKSRLRSLLLLAVLGAAVLATTGLSAISSGAGAFNSHLAVLGTGIRIGAIVLGAAVDVGIFIVAFRLLTAREVTTREILLGAVIAGVAWAVLQAVGTYYVAHSLKGTSAAYGLFAIVLGLVAWIHLESLVIVLCAELNVVVRHRLYPRALLTPFTDDVDLTSADRKAYTSYAKAQRNKGTEQIDVQFSPPPDEAGGR